MSILGNFASVLSQGAQNLVQQPPAPGTFGSALTSMNPKAQPQGAFGSKLTGMGGARPSGRSWLDPQRMEERLLRRQDRQSRMGGGGGGGGGSSQAAPLAPLPEGAFQKNATTGQEVTLLPPTMTSKMGGAFDRKRLERLGARFEPLVGLYDPRTGLSQTLTPTQAMQRGLLGSA